MDEGDALIHLRVPASLKGRWVRVSRAAGMRLSDWIVQAVEARMEMQQTRVIIPDEIMFADLRLARDADGHVSFDWRAIERVCAASGIDPALFRAGPEDNAAGLIVTWYRAHLATGGDRDPVADDLIAEVSAEDSRGQHVSHAPGRA